METSQLDNRYSWIRLSVSLALSLVGSVGVWAIIVVLPGMQSDFGTGRASASIPYTFCMVGFAVGNFVLGRFVDRWGMAPVLAISALTSSAGFAASALGSSIQLIALLHLLVGFGAAASFGPLIADSSQWFLKHRGIAVAIVASGNYLSGAIWPPMVAWLAADHGWRGAYLVLAVIVFAVVLPGSMLLRRQIDNVSTERATSAAAARAQNVNLSPGTLQALLAVAGVSCCVAMAMPQVHIVALCIDRGFGAETGAAMLSLMLAGGVVSRMVCGMLADRIGGLMVLAISGTLQMLTLSLFLVQGGIGSLYVISLIFGLSQGGIVPSYAIIVREYMPPREAGRRVGVVIGATILGMALGGWMTGWIYDRTGDYAMAIWNGLGWNLLNVAIALGILFRVSRNRRRIQG